MNILIDGQVLMTPEVQRGIGIYFIKVLENMVKNNYGDNWYIPVGDMNALNVIDEWVRSRITPIADPVFCPGTDYDREKELTKQLNHYIEELKIDAVWIPDPMMVNVLFPNSPLKQKLYITMFDLIPYVMPVKEWPDFVTKEYHRRIGYIKQNDVRCICISEATRKDLLNAVGSSAKTCVTMLAADENLYYKDRARRVDRPYILFTGGFDYRKNMEGAVEAYRLALKNNPDSECAKSVFYIVCACSEEKKNEFYKNLAPELQDRVILTGYLSDEELSLYYGGATLFFYPSLYEGFGLPIAEAMLSGTPVLCSGVSSMPEVGGDLADYCDPKDMKQMAAALKKSYDAALTEPLSKRKERQLYAARLTWKKTAEETYRYFNSKKHSSKNGKKLHIAIVTPWPNQQTGIANYVYRLMPYWAKYFDIDIFVDVPDDPQQEKACELLPNPYGGVFRLEELDETADLYDEMIFHIGNNSDFHVNIYKALRRHHGIAEIHDFDLSAFFYYGFFLTEEKELFEEALWFGYGKKGSDYYRELVNGLAYDGRYPMTDAVASYAKGTIMHNMWSLNQCKSPDDKFVIPHASFDIDSVDLTGTAESIKERINWQEGDVVISQMGFVNPNKRFRLVIKAFQMLAGKYPNVKLVFWGKEVENEATNLIEMLNLSRKAYVMGYLTRDEYQAGLDLSDVVVNLRYPSMGESSGTLCEAFKSGKPVIVSAVGQYMEFPDDVCWKLPVYTNEEEEIYALSRMLEKMITYPVIRKTIGKNAANYANEVLSCEKIAAQYRDCIYTIHERNSK